MARKNKLALIDAHALIHRAYHALPPMSTRQGRPTNAVYGFTTMLLKVLATIKPTHVVAAFDMAGPTFRHKAFADYKAQRKPAEEALVRQFDLVREVLRAFNVPVIEKQGFEADDILGTLVTRLDRGVKKVVVTGDLDTLQLVDDDTSVFTLKRGVSDTIHYTGKEVLERFGFAPQFIPDYKGLAGDPSDNIPGVPGIGDKIARELVAKYGSLEEIFAHVGELPVRVQQRLRGHKRDALSCRKLATIRRDVAVDFGLADAVVADFDAGKVRAIFEELEFRSLLARIPKSSRGPVQPTLFRNSKFEVRNPKLSDRRALPEHYYLVERGEEVRALQKLLAQQKIIAFDTETDRLGARRYPIVGMSFALRQAQGKPLHAYYVPVDRESVKAWRAVLEDPKVGKTGHNLKYDLTVLAQSGIRLQPIVFDSMIASYLLHPVARQHSLDTLAMQELGHHCIPITSLIGEGKDQMGMSHVPLTDLARYACEDAEVALRLYEVLAPGITEQGLTRVLEELELPLIAVLADMEMTGVRVEAAVLKDLQRTVQRRVRELRQGIYRAAGEEFNINSTQQLRAVLFEELRLPTVNIARTQSGYSTAAAELAKLSGQHVIIALLEEYRELTKLETTYLAALPQLIEKRTGRIYASFNQTVAATGRLSSTNPNLQNIPVRTPLGRDVRAAFVAPRGWRLVKADYSQLELRLAAHLSGDEKMREAFRAGEDIHRATAAWVFGVMPEAVTAAQRREAKTLNFGVLYGMGAQSFARAAGLSVEEARSFIERYWRQYEGLLQYRTEILQQAEALGFVETMFGRRLPVAELQSRAPAIRSAAERATFNFPIQGTAADILKKAMVALHDHLASRYPEARLVLTVHDELVCEAPARQAAALARAMQQIMAGVVTLDVPLAVEATVGSNWRDMAPAQ